MVSQQKELEDRAWLATKRVFNFIWQNLNSWCFKEPVDEEKHKAPGYYAAIKDPQDLSTIRQRLSSNKYREPRDVDAAIRTMCANAAAYNAPEHDVARAGAALLALWAEQWEERKVEALWAAARNPAVAAAASASLLGSRRSGSGPLPAPAPRNGAAAAAAPQTAAAGQGQGQGHATSASPALPASTPMPDAAVAAGRQMQPSNGNCEGVAGRSTEPPQQQQAQPTQSSPQQPQAAKVLQPARQHAQVQPQPTRQPAQQAKQQLALPQAQSTQQRVQHHQQRQWQAGKQSRVCYTPDIILKMQMPSSAVQPDESSLPLLRSLLRGSSWLPCTFLALGNLRAQMLGGCTSDPELVLVRCLCAECATQQLPGYMPLMHFYMHATGRDARGALDEPGTPPGSEGGAVSRPGSVSAPALDSQQEEAAGHHAERPDGRDGQREGQGAACEGTGAAEASGGREEKPAVAAPGAGSETPSTADTADGLAPLPAMRVADLESLKRRIWNELRCGPSLNRVTEFNFLDMMRRYAEYSGGAGLLGRRVWAYHFADFLPPPWHLFGTWRPAEVTGYNAESAEHEIRYDHDPKGPTDLVQLGCNFLHWGATAPHPGKAPVLGWSRPPPVMAQQQHPHAQLHPQPHPQAHVQPTAHPHVQPRRQAPGQPAAQPHTQAAAGGRRTETETIVIDDDEEERAGKAVRQDGHDPIIGPPPAKQARHSYDSHPSAPQPSASHGHAPPPNSHHQLHPQHAAWQKQQQLLQQQLHQQQRQAQAGAAAVTAPAASVAAAGAVPGASNAHSILITGGFTPVFPDPKIDRQLDRQVQAAMMNQLLTQEQRLRVRAGQLQDVVAELTEVLRRDPAREARLLSEVHAAKAALVRELMERRAQHMQQQRQQQQGPQAQGQQQQPNGGAAALGHHPLQARLQQQQLLQQAARQPQPAAAAAAPVAPAAHIPQFRLPAVPPMAVPVLPSPPVLAPPATVMAPPGTAVPVVAAPVPPAAVPGAASSYPGAAQPGQAPHGQPSPAQLQQMQQYQMMIAQHYAMQKQNPHLSQYAANAAAAALYHQQQQQLQQQHAHVHPGQQPPAGMVPSQAYGAPQAAAAAVSAQTVNPMAPGPHAAVPATAPPAAAVQVAAAPVHHPVAPGPSQPMEPAGSVQHPVLPVAQSLQSSSALQVGAAPVGAPVGQELATKLERRLSHGVLTTGLGGAPPPRPPSPAAQPYHPSAAAASSGGRGSVSGAAGGDEAAGAGASAAGRTGASAGSAGAAAEAAAWGSSRFRPMSRTLTDIGDMMHALNDLMEQVPLNAEEARAARKALRQLQSADKDKYIQMSYVQLVSAAKAGDEEEIRDIFDDLKGEAARVTGAGSKKDA